MTYAFPPFRLDTSARILTRDGDPVPLPPKAFDVLHALVEARGQIVSKQDLLDRVWPGVFVEEANLPQNVSLVRKALGESPKDHHFVVTLPGRGYRFVAHVEDDAPAPPPHPDSVAVLPFTNDTGDPSLDYLADGLTEGLISALTRVGGLRVKARAVVFRAKGREYDPQQAGRVFGVACVVVGRLAGQRVTVEIVETATGWQRWSGQWPHPLTDPIRLQEAIALDVAPQLRAALTAEEAGRLTARDTANTPAYQCYMKGRYFLNRRLTETLGQAVSWFRQATDHDPGFALAYVGTADTYALQSLYGSMTPAEAFPRSKAAALEALRIDPGLSEAHNSLGVVALFYEWDGASAEASFERALALNPSYADAHQRLGMLFTSRGRFDDARQALARAQALDPLSLINATIAAYPDYYERRFDDANRQLRRVLEMDPEFSMAHYRLGLSLMAQGRYEEAESSLRVSQRLSRDRDVDAALGRLAALRGDRAEALRAADALVARAREGFVSSYDLAVIHAALGDVDTAFGWLTRATEERSYWLIYRDVDPALDDLRHDPRFRTYSTSVS